MTLAFNESIVEDTALTWFGDLSVAMATCKNYLQVQRATIVRLKGA
jgi:hypothetical protein